MRLRLLLPLVCLAANGCGSPTSPTASDVLAIREAWPARGSSVVVPPQYPYFTLGGVVLPQGSGVLSVSMSLNVEHDIPWAQLNVYLLTGGTNDQYCGQNLPDSPTWKFLTPGWKTAVTVTGFQIYRLPCDVTGVRAMLHMRNNGLLGPPTATETIAETIFSTDLHLLR